MQPAASPDCSGKNAETKQVNLFQKVLPKESKPDRDVYIRAGMVDLIEGHPYSFAYERSNLTLSSPSKPAVKEGVIQSPRNFKPSVVSVKVPPGAKRFKASFGYLTSPTCEPTNPTVPNSGTQASVHKGALNLPKASGIANAGNEYPGARVSSYRAPAADFDVQLDKGAQLIYLRAGHAGNDWCADVVWSGARFTM